MSKDKIIDKGNERLIKCNLKYIFHIFGIINKWRNRKTIWKSWRNSIIPKTFIRNQI